MSKDKRKHNRRYLQYNAWIGTGTSLLRGCVISDISHTGARLDVENPDDLPERFRLLFSAPGSVDRKCHIVWRTTKQVGVEFEKASEKRRPPVRPVDA
jgi:hypothetical protein